MLISLRNISISHTSTSLQRREQYHLSTEEIMSLTNSLQRKFPDISGLMILSTCNRTEIYFESMKTQSKELNEFFIQLINPDVDINQELTLFHNNNRTVDTAFHLLQVANGLRSAVVGDQQILNQIKAAYNQSRDFKIQGSILERTLQAVFRSHKRISNESSFRNGSRSTAYRALKIIQDGFGKETTKHKSLLIIGAGEIAQDVLQYLRKFTFKEVYISNRTEQKAMNLASIHHIKRLQWKYVESNNFERIDAIISAVGNRKHLVNTMIGEGKKIIVDLSLPANVHPSLSRQDQIELYDLDNVTEQIDLTDHIRYKAIKDAEIIIKEEMSLLSAWLQKGQVRKFISDYKQHTINIIQKVLTQTNNIDGSPEQTRQLAEAIARKLVKSPAVTMNNTCEGELSENSMKFIQKAFTNNDNL